MESQKKEKPSKFVSIRDIPQTWDENVITKKCSAYGFIDNVTIDRSTRVAIVKFEDESDAVDFIEDASYGNEFQATFDYSFTDTDTTNHNEDSEVNWEGPFECGNPSCSRILMKTRSATFCSYECHAESSIPPERNMYDIWIAALGRSGSGLLADRKNLDNLEISVDPNGFRSITITPSPRRSQETAPETNEALNEQPESL